MFADGLSQEFEWQHVYSGQQDSSQADLNNVVVWMVSIRLPISSSSNSFSKPLGIVLSALVTIGISVTPMFHVIIIIIIIIYEFFSPVLSSDISLESEWQLVSSGFQDSFQ